MIGVYILIGGIAGAIATLFVLRAAAISIVKNGVKSTLSLYQMKRVANKTAMDEALYHRSTAGLLRLGLKRAEREMRTGGLLNEANIAKTVLEENEE